MSDELNGLDDKINVRGFFERVFREREKLEEERIARIEDRFEAMERALVLQAEEYARRLHDLNGEYQRDRGRQANYVTIDKYETGLKAEAEARFRETLRANERFDDYLEMYEKRHRELEDEVRSRTPQGQFDDYRKNESTARVSALLRVDEKFEEYVKRYEIRQHEIDILLSAQKGAAEEAIRAAEEQGRKSNRNIGIAGVVLGIVVFVANVVPFLVQ